MQCELEIASVVPVSDRWVPDIAGNSGGGIGWKFEIQLRIEKNPDPWTFMREILFKNGFLQNKLYLLCP